MMKDRPATCRSKIAADNFDVDDDDDVDDDGPVPVSPLGQATPSGGMLPPVK